MPSFLDIVSQAKKPIQEAAPKLVFLDTETHRISHESPVPPLVCLQYAVGDEEPRIVGGTQEGKEEAYSLWNYWKTHDYTMVAHNGFFDYSRLEDMVDYWKPANTRNFDQGILDIISLALSGRIRDTLPMAKLNAIMYGWMGFDKSSWSKPKFSLSYLANRFLSYKMGGKDGNEDNWRLNYHKLDGLDPDRWPQDARQYALDDITVLRRLFYKLDENHYQDEAFQTASFWIFRLMELWGLHTNKERVEALKSKIVPYIESAHEKLIDSGYMRPGTWVKNTERLGDYVRSICSLRGMEPQTTPTGKVKLTAAYLKSLNVPILLEKEPWLDPVPPSRDFKKIKTRIVEWYTERGLDVPRVEKKRAWSDGTEDEEDFWPSGDEEDYEDSDPVDADPLEGVAMDREALTSTDDPNLQLLGEIGKLKTLNGTFIPKMEMGYENPLRPGWNGLVVTGRPSCVAGEYGTNLLNQPKEIRKGEPGVREVYQAREGMVYLDGDLTQAELCALSQVCIDKFGYSNMGQIINSGKDLHSWFASNMCELSYQEVLDGLDSPDKDLSKRCKDLRQMAKAANFGFPGGLGVQKFIKWARKTYELNFTERQVRELKADWLASFPEIVDYFAWVNDQLRQSGRKKFDYTQHRSGRIRGNCGYCDGLNTGFQGLTADGTKNAMIKIAIACHTPGDDLYGWRIAAQIYDEMLMEGPRATLGRAAPRFIQLFQDGVTEYTPDVPAKVTAEAMYNWSKKAKAVYKNGEMVPFDEEDL